MAERFDALTVRESNGKSYFTKIGAMFPNKNGDGFTLVLDAVPASNEGQYRIIMVTPKERDDKPQGGGWTGKAPATNDRGGGAWGDDLGDDAPF